jgi:hypothetical protein
MMDRDASTLTQYTIGPVNLAGLQRYNWKFSTTPRNNKPGNLASIYMTICLRIRPGLQNYVEELSKISPQDSPLKETSVSPMCSERIEAECLQLQTLLETARPELKIDEPVA